MNTLVSPELDKLLLEKDIPMPVNPIIADVVMWLYEKHGIWVFPEWQFGRKMWLGTIHDITSHENTIKIQDKYYKDMGEAEYSLPTEAYEAAITYTLNNLI